MFDGVLRHRFLRIVAAALMLAGAASLAGCGRRGDLEPPPGVDNPAPPPGTPREAPEEGERPTEPFILDHIL